MTNIPQDHAAVTFCMSYVCSIRSPSLVWWGPARVADFTLLFKESFFFFIDIIGGIGVRGQQFGRPGWAETQSVATLPVHWQGHVWKGALHLRGWVCCSALLRLRLAGGLPVQLSGLAGFLQAASQCLGLIIDYDQSWFPFLLPLDHMWFHILSDIVFRLPTPALFLFKQKKKPSSPSSSHALTALHLHCKQNSMKSRFWGSSSSM